MHTLWAPWRLEFIEAEKSEGCVFCHFLEESGPEADQRNLIVARTSQSFAILNRYPYTSGHLMVIPQRHTADLPSLDEEESRDLHRLLQLSLSVLTAAYQPDGFNVGMNLGRSAGAGIVGHLHYHLVPRWVGDTNFMPVLADTKVMVEHLQTTFEKVRPHYQRLLESC